MIGVNFIQHKENIEISERYDLKKGFLDVSLEMEALEVPAQIDGKKVVSFNYCLQLFI